MQQQQKRKCLAIQFENTQIHTDTERFFVSNFLKFYFCHIANQCLGCGFFVVVTFCLLKIQNL